MSSEIYFFVRKDNNFLPIACYTRSSTIYEFFNGSFCAVRPLTRRTLYDIQDAVQDELKELNRHITSCHDSIKLVCTFQNSSEEKLESIYSIQKTITDLEEIRKDLDRCLNFCYFLEHILETAEDTQYCDSDDIKFDLNDYIYYGVDTGFNITDDMIQN